MHYACLPVLFAVLLSSPLFASPLVVFDKTTVDCGTVVEGKVQKLHASFQMRNTGTDALRVLEVKSGCGCTVATFDSVIEPGKTGLVRAEVDLKAVNPGKVSKSLVVISNATNERAVRLTMNAVLKPAFMLSESYLPLGPYAADTGRSIIVSALGSNLVVKEVVFKQGVSMPPIPVEFKWATRDSARADGYKTYRLTLFPPRTSKELSGNLWVKTDYAEKPEFSIYSKLSIW